MRHIFLINSFTVKDKVEELKEKIKEYCRLNKIDYEIEINSLQNETEDILKKYQNTKYIIIAIGGDGIINRTLNSIVNTKNILSFIPYGTGNDFYRTVKKQLKIGNNKCDIVKINNKYFINTACFGIDADVANNKNIVKTNLIPKKQKYNISLVYNFFKYKCRNFKVNIDNKIYNDSYTTIALTNGMFYGSGYNIGPSSNITDGEFEVYLAPKLNKLSMIKLILKMKKGKHESSPYVIKHVTKKLTITSDKIVKCNIDGETLEDNKFNIFIIKEGITLYYNEDMIQKLSK